MLWPACSRGGLVLLCVGGAAHVPNKLCCLAVLTQPYMQAGNRRLMQLNAEATRGDLGSTCGQGARALGGAGAQLQLLQSVVMLSASGYSMSSGASRFSVPPAFAGAPWADKTCSL